MTKKIRCFKCNKEIDIEDLIKNWCPHCNKSLQEEKEW